jgi:predicted Ser/Thr protein kinase
MSDSTLPIPPGGSPPLGVTEGPTRVADPVSIGPYRVLEKIGAGGMGAVYLGKHVDSGLVAAVKVLPASLAREEGFVERFNREIEAMRKLDNAHTVKLYDSGVDGETYYYAMEFVEGETLMGLLKREKRVPWQRAVEIAIQVCQALKAAHDTGIIHRDLKPSNLLLTLDGSVKLVDFGVAQVFAANRLTVTGGIIGTAEFMSPEQAQGRRATKQSDLYSLGAVMYCMVAGRPPFSGGTAVEIIQKHRFGQFDRAKTYVPEVPTWLDDLIAQLLDKDPAKRFPDAYVLSRHLEAEVRRFHYRELGGSANPDAPTLAADGVPLGATRLEAGSAGGAGPATLARNAVKAALAESPAGWLSQALDRTVVQVGLLMLALGAITWFSWPRQFPPETMYDRAVDILEGEPGPEWIEARDQYLNKLMALEDATWVERAEPLMQQVALYEATRRGATGRGLKPADANRSEPLRMIQRGLLLQRNGHPEAAERVLMSLARLLARDPATAELAKLVQRLADRARDDWQGISARRATWIEDLLRKADDLAKQGETAAAREVWDSFLELYAEDPELEEVIKTVREKREALPVSSPSESK